MTFLTLVVVIYEYKIEACGMFVVKTRDETQACNKQSSRRPIQNPSVERRPELEYDDKCMDVS